MPQAKRNEAGALGGLFAGIIGGVVFLALWLLFELPVIVALAVGLAGYGAGLLAFRRRPRELAVDIPGLSREAVTTALKEGGEKVDELTALSSRIPDQSIRAKFDAIVAAAESILEDLRKNPKDIRSARQFLNYYLDATIKIVGRYADLREKNLESADIKASLGKAEAMLDMIRSAFEKQHARLLQDDVLDLDAEMSLLKQTIQMEGLGEEEGKA